MNTKPDVPPPAMCPMDEFNPSEPAILHDRISDTIVTWTGDKGGEWQQYAKRRTVGIIEFEGYLFDGWGDVLGG